jgi:hypothetical protein
MLSSKETRNPGGRAAVGKTKTWTTDLDPDVIRRLKIYSAATGQTIKSLVNRWLDERLPPLPREREATA